MVIKFYKEIQEPLSEIIEIEHDMYERSYGVQCNYAPFCFTALEGEQTYGVISGYTCYSEIYIDDLIVFTPYRGKGIGRKLVETVEQYFANKSYNNINLVTNAFQAPQFYEKCGFTLEFTRRNIVNPLLSKHFYIKFLDG